MSTAGALWFAVQDDVFSNVLNDTPATIDSTTRGKHPSQSSTSTSTSDSERHSLLDRFDDSFLLHKFHLNRECLRFIIDYIHIRFASSQSLMTTEARILAAVYFYANGSLSREIADRLEIDENECRETVKNITKQLSDMSPDFITFPSSYNDRRGAAQLFKRVCCIPHVVGVLGYFHVKVSPAPGQEQMFVNTLGYHSAMMQVIFDLYGNILSLEQCCPGGTPEHNVWASTIIGKQFTTFQHGHSWVLGKNRTVHTDLQ